jgi:hypothetical protein
MLLKNNDLNSQSRRLKTGWLFIFCRENMMALDVHPLGLTKRARLISCNFAYFVKLFSRTFVKIKDDIDGRLYPITYCLFLFLFLLLENLITHG